VSETVCLHFFPRHQRWTAAAIGIYCRLIFFLIQLSKAQRAVVGCRLFPAEMRVGQSTEAQL
jgi:hypothetical protein